MKSQVIAAIVLGAIAVSQQALAVVNYYCPAPSEWKLSQLSPVGTVVFDAATTTAGSFIQEASVLKFKAPGASSYVQVETDVLAIQAGSSSGLIYLKWEPYSQTHQVWSFVDSTHKTPFPQLAGGVRAISSWNSANLRVVGNDGFVYLYSGSGWGKVSTSQGFTGGDIEIDGSALTEFVLEAAPDLNTARRVFRYMGYGTYAGINDGYSPVLGTSIGACKNNGSSCVSYTYQNAGPIFAWSGNVASGTTYSVYNPQDGVPARKVVRITTDAHGRWMGSYINTQDKWMQFWCEYHYLG